MKALLGGRAFFASGEWEKDGWPEPLRDRAWQPSSKHARMRFALSTRRPPQNQLNSSADGIAIHGDVARLRVAHVHAALKTRAELPAEFRTTTAAGWLYLPLLSAPRPNFNLWRDRITARIDGDVFHSRPAI